MSGPLEGFRVLEWAVFQAGSIASSMLGDQGADVIKIEHPIRGDDQRGLLNVAGSFMGLPGGKQSPFEHANRNKRDITLDLRSPSGAAILRKLIERSDAFVTNFRQTVLERAKMDYETLRQYNPRLVYGMLSSYGTKGDDVNKRSFDTAGQARSGMMFAMGTRDSSEPTQMQGAPLDQLGGTLLAYAVVSALLERERTGKGRKVETSILGGGVHLYAFDLNVAMWTGRPLARHSRTRSRNAMANTYQCGDGKWLIFAEYQTDRFWHDFCDALGITDLENHPHFVTSRERSEHYAEVIPALDKVFAGKTRAEWLDIFRRKECRFAYELVNAVEDVPSDPQVTANDYIVEFDHPTMGRASIVGSPVRFEGYTVPMRPAPEFGEHTEEVLLECGYGWEEIARFREEGAI